MKILFFAGLKEQLGCSELDLSAQHISTVSDLLEHLCSRNEAWRNALSSRNLKVAVNQEICHSNHSITNDDEIAIFPPVTGG